MDASQGHLLAEGAAPRETVDCLLCGGARHEPVVEAGDPLRPEGETFQLVRCLDCGLGYVRSRPTREGMARHYPPEYAPHGLAEEGGERGDHAEPEDARWHGRLGTAVLRVDYGYPAQPWAGSAGTRPGVLTRALAWLGRRTLSRRDTQRWIPWRPGGRLLDVGCGAGRFLMQMRALGWTVEGCDTSPGVVSDLAERGFVAHLGDLTSLTLPGETFDALTLWASLEHVHDPRATLRAAHHLLRPGGVLGLTVPNLDSWSFSEFGPHWFGLDLPRHLVHFTPATLTRLVTEAGFRVTELTHVGRASWIRKSAAGTRYAGRRAARQAARASERAGRADSLRLYGSRIKVD